ncbi:hypothetical protein [Streptomyces sp. NBC_01373]|uniref:hypothetical protein n=1 Tax=unclassified Streptomyces TaxID=2593676 RepID=UPI00225B8E02|nr:hypothetical protein [Streptomyces sp. NBC_01373]MCX4703077.1 hypothetical protein [Streptomyces sp. NBC_01373]
MSGQFSANVPGIWISSKHVENAVKGSEEMGPRFEANWAATAGWWGEEGDDDFANQVGPQCEREKEQVLGTVDAITDGFQALIGALAQSADYVQRPQTDAIDSIAEQGSEGEARR